MEPLTKSELTCLRWCRTNNAQNIGFLGPTVFRTGPLTEYADLVSRGLVRVIGASASSRPKSAYGYWITEAGRAALRLSTTREKPTDRGRG